jgi:hypothetical protein
VAENESDPGLTFNVAAGLTVKLTGTERVMPLPVLVTVPVNVPAESPVTIDETVKVAGVVPVEGETLSQDPPLTVAVKAVLGEALIDRLCAPGEVPPAVAVNDNEEGLTFSVRLAEATVKVTGTRTVLSSP